MNVLKYAVERKKTLMFILVFYTSAFLLFENKYRKPKDIVEETKPSQNLISDLLSVLWTVKNAHSLPSVSMDVHLEDPIHGHTGLMLNEKPFHSGYESNLTTVAIGLGITSKGVRIDKQADITSIATTFLFFNTLLFTFCNTASPQYSYRFYLAYDHTDSFFTDTTYLQTFQKAFIETTGRMCNPNNISTSLHFVQCSHTGRPTWAQNDAMLEAYLDHVDYYYRVNDDTRFQTEGWTNKCIDTLTQYDPKRIGVVGPTHSGGNTGILTYDFVHRTHIDIFGFYYPRLFTSWWGDDWMTRVYKPNRSTKLSDVRLAHTLQLGQRYGLLDASVGGKLGSQLEKDKSTLHRYILTQHTWTATRPPRDGRRVISMSLYGQSPRYTWGAIRNAQLLPVLLPSWTLRLYIAADPDPPELVVPPRILAKLRILGCQIARVTVNSAEHNETVQPRQWRLLVADDSNVDFFLIRDADWRLSEREATAVRSWTQSAESGGPEYAVVYCIRDHPKHANSAIVDGLWGGRPAALRRRLKQSLYVLLKASSPNETSFFFSRIVWPAVEQISYCHDSVSPCFRWLPRRQRQAFPVTRQGHEYVGEKYNEHQELVSSDTDHATGEVVCITSTMSTA